MKRSEGSKRRSKARGKLRSTGLLDAMSSNEGNTSVKNKVAVVTGGASGIGYACAQELGERGVSVAIIDREGCAGARALQELRALGRAVEFVRADVSQSREVESAVREVMTKFGRIDILVNNAGIQRYGTVTTTSEEEWDEVLNANLKSAFLVSKYVIPEMMHNGGGAVVIVASVQSFAAQRNSAAYVSSKHALLGLTRSMAIDYAKKCIRVNCVCPGAIDTPMLRWAVSLDPDPDRVMEACGKSHVLGRIGHPREVARVVAFLASDQASFMTGSAVMVDGGLLVPAGGMAFQETGTGVTSR
jgi:NAD(P)-dependent dehydrogenase (short-subunit alcohol dehydrogenase family)